MARLQQGHGPHHPQALAPFANPVIFLFLGGMAWLAAHWAIPLRQLALGHGFAWLEGAVMAGVKLVPFGQQAAQTLLRDLGADLPAALDQALVLGDDQLGGGLPLLAIASSRHETQYTRLFRS